MRQPLLQGRVSDRAMRAVMKGVYYRHEFARRNPDLSAESGRLLGLFPKVLEEAGGACRFTLDVPSRRTIAHGLIESFRKLSGRAAEHARDGLAGFLMRWRVIPFPPVIPEKFHPDGGEFFTFPVDPSDNKNWGDLPGIRGRLRAAEDVYFEYLAVLQFEAFALAELGLGEPVFMPAMVLPTAKDKLRMAIDGIAGRIRENAPTHNMIFVDYSHPFDGLRSHFEALRSWDFVKGALGKRAPVVSRAGYVTWENLDGYLAAVDCLRRTATPSMAAAERILSSFMPASEWEKSRSGHSAAGNLVPWAIRRLKDWGREGETLVADYKSII